MTPSQKPSKSIGFRLVDSPVEIHRPPVDSTADPQGPKVNPQAVCRGCVEAMRNPQVVNSTYQNPQPNPQPVDLAVDLAVDLVWIRCGSHSVYVCVGGFVV